MNKNQSVVLFPACETVAIVDVKEKNDFVGEVKMCLKVALV